jgi:hypothetical protein
MVVLADEKKEGMGGAKLQRQQKNVTFLVLQFHHDNLQKTIKVRNNNIFTVIFLLWQLSKQQHPPCQQSGSRQQQQRSG